MLRHMPVAAKKAAAYRKDGSIKMRVAEAEIRAYLIGCYGVDPDCVKTGDEVDEAEAGLFYGEADSWLVYGTMPNTNETGWFFAGYSEDLAREILATRDI